VYESLTQEDIDKQWPGFKVQCQQCGSTRVRLDNSIGYSDVSGPFGSMDLVCLDCHQQTMLMDTY
jgi:hypothetical protein